MRAHKHISQGFGLVEIMVGLGIGMMAMIVVMQVFSQSEAQKRSTTSGADAQSNGAIGLSMIERDTRMAGWGMASSQYANCNTAFTYCDGSEACGGAAGPLGDFSLAAVRVTDGGNNPDTITAQYFADPNLGSFRYPSNTRLRSTMPQPSAELNVASTAGCKDGDLVLVQQAGNCTLMQITGVQEQALKIQHNPGGSGIYNPPANYQNSNGWPAYTTGATLACFSAPETSAMFRRTYSVDSARRQLLRSDNSTESTATNEPVVPEIIDLQVEYGVAPANSQAVDTWVAATGALWANPSMENRKRIKAVRVALVARSAQYEKPAPNEPCKTTTPDMVAKWSSWATFKTTGYPADWQCYRYKVFETVVPLRNVLWGNI
jgi:type IV pilus assembly protein PilW